MVGWWDYCGEMVGYCETTVGELWGELSIFA